MDPLLIPLAALAIPIIVVPTALGFKHAARLREYDHAERMRALELGRFNPGDETWSVAAWISVVIGAFVPISAILAAMGASMVVGFYEEIWMAAGIVGVSGVICGTFLAARLRGVDARDLVSEKPVYEPDAFDVVGRRG